jgi:hypothetical protein
MTEELPARRLRFKLPRTRGFAYIFLVLAIFIYPALITYSSYARFDSSRSAQRIIILWALGAVAIAIVTRSWRRERK